MLCKLKCFSRPGLQRARDTGFLFTMSNSCCFVCGATAPPRSRHASSATRQKARGRKQEVEAPRGAGAERRTLACNDAARRNAWRGVPCPITLGARLSALHRGICDEPYRPGPVVPRRVDGCTPGANLPKADRRGPPLPTRHPVGRPEGFLKLEQNENNTDANEGQWLWTAGRAVARMSVATCGATVSRTQRSRQWHRYAGCRLA
jgi:hypothetical protein